MSADSGLPDRKTLRPPVVEVDHPAALTTPPPPDQADAAGGGEGPQRPAPRPRRTAGREPGPARPPQPGRRTRRSATEYERAGEELLALAEDARTQVSARIPTTVARAFGVYCRILQTEQQVLLPQLMIAAMARDGYWPPPWDSPSATPSTE